MNKFLSILFSAFILALSVSAKVEFPAVIGNNMVLQQNSNANLWGKAKASSKLTVFTSWDNKKYVVNTDAKGKWKLAVVTPKAGGPYQITFDDGDKAILDNILIGEVWVCSGQSNMVMPVKGYNNQPVFNVMPVVLESNNDEIRLFTVKTATAAEKQDDLSGDWKISNPQNAMDFSAAAYVYGQTLQKYLGVPVGLIVSAVGGTPIRAWTSAESLKEIPEITVKLGEKLTKNDPTVLYNAMIAPLTNYTARGFLWYQGENDRTTFDIYEKQMQVMVKSWRAVWGQGDLPFYYVQIAPWNYDGKHISPFLRESQLKASHSIPNVGMAVTMDIGSDRSIHPDNKVDVGKRLAYIALGNTYSVTGLPYLGPEYKDMQITGNKATLTFSNIGMGMYFTNKQSNNFEISGDNRVFYPAKATITSKGLVVESDKVAKPVAVRYAFKDFVVGDLFNNVGLPASSFRTDSWPIKQ